MRGGADHKPCTELIEEPYRLGNASPEVDDPVRSAGVRESQAREKNTKRSDFETRKRCDFCSVPQRTAAIFLRFCRQFLRPNLRLLILRFLHEKPAIILRLRFFGMLRHKD